MAERNDPVYNKNVLHGFLRADFFAFMKKCFKTVVPADKFIDGPHLEYICDCLERAWLGEIKRMVITLPPRSLKSLITSIAFPTWVLGQDPAHRIITASYSSDLALKFARDSRLVMKSAWYREVFPNVNLARDTDSELKTHLGGFRLATSVGATLTGRGGHMLIIDDPLKPEEALSTTSRTRVNTWFDGTAFSRLDNKKDGVIIVIQQRLHEDDLVGHLLAKKGWHHVNLPAIATEHEDVPLRKGYNYTRYRGMPLNGALEPLSVLETTRKTIGEFNFQSQYQQSPVPVEGNLIKQKWFPRSTCPPRNEPGTYIVQSWDTASKITEISDFSVCITFLVQGNDFHVLDVSRERLDYPSLNKKVVQMAQTWNAKHVLVEEASSGIQLIQDLADRSSPTRMPLIAIKPEGEKLMRMHTQCGHIQAGQVHLPLKAPWLDLFLTEILAFPQGKHDDQVDALSQFLKWITTPVIEHTASVRSITI